jgi:hypothetical protein
MKTPILVICLASVIGLVNPGGPSLSWASKPPSREVVQQRLAAIEKARVEQVAYLRNLDATFTAEARNEAWASKKESELKQSPMSAKGLKQARLLRFDCRTSRCKLEFQAGTDSTQVLQQQQAINDWISSVQSCGFTMASVPGDGNGGSASLLIYLDCVR